MNPGQIPQAAVDAAFPHLHGNLPGGSFPADQRDILERPVREALAAARPHLSIEDKAWSIAIDWLINQPLDPEVIIRFNCLADGLATRDEVDSADPAELVARQEAAERAAGTLH